MHSLRRIVCSGVTGIPSVLDAHGSHRKECNNPTESRGTEMDADKTTDQPDLPTFFEGQRLSHVPLMQMVECIRDLCQRVSELEAEIRRMQTPEPKPVPQCHEVWIHHDGTVGGPQE